MMSYLVNDIYGHRWYFSPPSINTSPLNLHKFLHFDQTLAPFQILLVKKGEPWNGHGSNQHHPPPPDLVLSTRKFPPRPLLPPTNAATASIAAQGGGGGGAGGPISSTPVAPPRKSRREKNRDKSLRQGGEKNESSKMNSIRPFVGEN